MVPHQRKRAESESLDSWLRRRLHAPAPAAAGARPPLDEWWLSKFFAQAT